MFYRILHYTLACLIAMPVVVVILAWLFPDIQLWTHFWQTLLPSVMINTVMLLFGVAVGVSFLGTLLAWLVVMVDFPGRRYFEIALFFPFVIPAYVLGFVYLGLFDYAGPAQDLLRRYFDFDGVDIRGEPFITVLVFVLVFYPYVYMLARAAFKRQKTHLIESAKLLGCNKFSLFWRLSLPMARPAIVAGVALTLMEVLSDFGVVSLFNYDTFTTAIYSAWEDYRSIEIAAQISSLLVVLALVLIQLERTSRGASRYYADDKLTAPPLTLKPYQRYLASVFVLGVLLLAFMLPITQLIVWSVGVWESISTQYSYLMLFWNSFILMIVSATLTVIVATLLAVSQRFTKDKKLAFINRFATIGYALPGSVMAIGLLYAIEQVSNVSVLFGGERLNSIVFGSVFLLIFAYISRFISLAYNPVDAALQQIKPSMVEAASLLRAVKSRVVRLVYLPMIKPTLLAALLLVAIDVMKELPATYLLRPFGWDTLAIKVYELSNEGLYQNASLPALIMVLTGGVLMAIFYRLDKKS